MFSEHLLFLWTKKYPEESGYAAYLSANGGASNAYTALCNTNVSRRSMSCIAVNVRPSTDSRSRLKHSSARSTASRAFSQNHCLTRPVPNEKSTPSTRNTGKTCSRMYGGSISWRNTCRRLRIRIASLERGRGRRCGSGRGPREGIRGVS